MKAELLCPSGALLDLTAPAPATIHLVDLAVGLAATARYRGAAGGYTVAQHSVLLSHAAGLTPAERRWALLHDAAEAYLGDLPAPAKALCPDYCKLEECLLYVVALRFGLPTPGYYGCVDVPAAVQAADRAIRAWEVSTFVDSPAWVALAAQDPTRWERWWGPARTTSEVLATLPEHDRFAYRQCWRAPVAADLWMARAAELGLKEGA